MQENEVLQTEQQEAINRTEEIFGEIMKQIHLSRHSDRRLLLSEQIVFLL